MVDEFCTCQTAGKFRISTSCVIHNPIFGVAAQAQEAIGQPVQFVGLSEMLDGIADDDLPSYRDLGDD